jgi:hypothetical protein
MSILEKLTEGIVNRNMAQEGEALLNKWSSTGLLEGLQSENDKSNMARLLENQAKELLRESNTMAGGDIQGFAAVAFPIVRRVFAGLIANDLVSVQPMSLPSGLVFFLDFAFGNKLGDTTIGARLGETAGTSIYGQGVLGSQVTGGVSLNSANIDKQPYAFASAWSSPTGSTVPTRKILALGMDGKAIGVNLSGSLKLGDALTGSFGYQTREIIRNDPDLIAEHSSSFLTIGRVLPASNFNYDDLSQYTIISGGMPVGAQVRRLTQVDPNDTAVKPHLIVVFVTTGSVQGVSIDAYGVYESCTYPIVDGLENVGAGALGAIKGTDTWGLEGNPNIPEIDIRVDSIAITARTKKLKAKWTPELGQDLNAYHNLDAEVELTSILSEQIALEIDREILSDLVNGATAETYFWSRAPGLFVNRLTGEEIGAASAAPDFTGTVSEWYETLIETINDVSAQIHRKTLRGGANFVVCSPEVANILEFTAGFRANVTADADKGEIGAVKVGSLNRKFDVIVDPYFLRNVILVGRKGSSFLESGYVYAPYVPLQTTPTIFGPEDFVPRKGVMTRYGKLMVRPDMYGLVIIRGLLGEAGSTGV